VKKPKKYFDWVEFDEAVEFFRRRFAGKDVKISPCGFAFRVARDLDDWKTIQYMVLRDKKGWTIWELMPNGDKPSGTFHSYKQTAKILEQRILAN